MWCYRFLTSGLLVIRSQSAKQGFIAVSGVGQEQFMEFRRASGPYGDFAWRKKMPAAALRIASARPRFDRLQFVFCRVRSEILYLPHILSTAGFGYGQESPVGRWDCKPDRIAGTEQE